MGENNHSRCILSFKISRKILGFTVLLQRYFTGNNNIKIIIAHFGDVSGFASISPPKSVLPFLQVVKGVGKLRVA